MLFLSRFCEFKKKFDCVNKEKSLLNRYRLRGIFFDWIKSYFELREQRVSINESPSKNFLRLLLWSIKSIYIRTFSFFINYEWFNKFNYFFFKLILFADDSTFSTVVNPLIYSRITARLISREFQIAFNWFISIKHASELVDDYKVHDFHAQWDMYATPYKTCYSRVL